MVVRQLRRELLDYDQSRDLWLSSVSLEDPTVFPDRVYGRWVPNHWRWLLTQGLPNREDLFVYDEEG